MHEIGFVWFRKKALHGYSRVSHDITDLSGFACNDNVDLTGYARKIIILQWETLGICLLLHEGTVYTDANNNGLLADRPRAISEMTKTGFVWFCKKAPQMSL